ncbi:MAG: S-methyl-5-thioribose-1-phosphate isomerase [Candidatus Latescibacteria bacterium]|nr:S-methyl-5-thioribose-1-phosphate isomerase [Candidatus Latescibacterota bacterium]
MKFNTLKWTENGLEIIDQRLLPIHEKYIILSTTDEVCQAIKTLAVRGAPAIGVAASYGVVVAAKESTSIDFVRSSMKKLRLTRPTAVNLFTALDKMESQLETAFDSGDPINFLLCIAQEIHHEDYRICKNLSIHGAELLSDGDTVLTHCNAGALATSGYGTALGVVYAAVESGKKISVFADETRPLLQGARLTAWELAKNDIYVTVICDNMAATVLREGKIDHVIVGADRIASNGDAANKIGTYPLSICAKEHNVPFYVAAPLTSFDFSIATGAKIPIEQRSEMEIHTIFGMQVAPANVSFYNPAFDVTPFSNITAIISEKGIARQPFNSILKQWSIK